MRITITAHTVKIRINAKTNLQGLWWLLNEGEQNFTTKRFNDFFDRLSIALLKKNQDTFTFRLTPAQYEYFSNNIGSGDPTLKYITYVEDSAEFVKDGEDPPDAIPKLDPDIEKLLT